MVYCLSGVLSYTTAARRDAVVADALAFIAGQSTWDVVEITPMARRLEPFCVSFMLRFTTKANQQSLLTHIDNAAKGQNTPEPGSYVSVHDCTHDESTPVDCIEETRISW